MAKNKVGIGMQVEIELLSRNGNNENMVLIIVPDDSSDYEKGYLGASTPLANILSGREVGESIPYDRDDLYAVRIIRIEHGPDIPLADLASERQARYQKAVRDAERSNAINFASSFSGKWGDYDPDSLLEEQNDEQEN